MTSLMYALFLGFIIGGVFAAELRDWQSSRWAGADVFDFREQKKDCEKSLPRDQECVMVFDFVAVNKEKSE